MESISLLILIFSPLLIAFFMLLPILPSQEVLIRRFAKTFAAVHFLYTLLFLVFFDNTKVLPFEENIKFFGTDWITRLGVSLNFAIDGISLLMVILTSLIILLACIASKSHIREKHKFYYALIFILETAILGIFTTSDMFIFFTFWELELIPMYFLIGNWGNSDAKKSAMKFLLYTFAGSLFMLLGLLMLYNFSYVANSQLTADIYKIVDYATSIPFNLQVVIAIFLLIGFAVKMPIVPFHTWLPNAHTDAPTPISMILAGLLLKIGAYGILRFNMQILPDSFAVIAPYLFVLAIINIIYTAVVAYAQTDIKKVVAYSSISNMGIVLLGFASLNILGISGGYFQMIAHSLVAAGLFMIVGCISLRCRTREISQLGGLVEVMPRLLGFTIVIALAAVGCPLTMSFVGEFLSFYGAFNSSLIEVLPVQTITFISLSILILSVAYILRLFHKAFFGNIFEQWRNLKDITNHEFIILFVISSIIILFGVLPNNIFDIVIPYLTNIVNGFGG